METITLNITDKSILPSLLKVLGKLDGVSIVNHTKEKKSGLDLAREDVKAGRLIEYGSKEELFADLGL